MKQVLLIHGGSSFSSHEEYIEYLKNTDIDYEKLKYKQKWKPWIAEHLINTDVLLPTFPKSDDALYVEWVIYFEKLLPLLQDDVQLVGHSLGAMFLAKYLNEHSLQYPCKKLILIAGAYSTDEHEVGSFTIQTTTHLEKNAKQIHLFHSQDDPIVAYSNLAKFQADLPNAISHVFKNRGHFNDETFPELLQLLEKSDEA